jgi:hypothetical protein
MAATRKDLSDRDFIRAWAENDFSADKVSNSLGLHVRNVFARRASLVAQGYILPNGSSLDNTEDTTAYKLRENIQIENGVMVVVSDRHKWPGDGITQAEAALLTLLPRIKPDVFIFNGDLFDGASIGRHPPLGWEKKPNVKDELDACVVTLERIEHQLPGNCRKLYTIGNHCRRFDYKLAMTASDYRGISGFRLKDHFVNWDLSWSVHVNAGHTGGHTVIKHKHRQGVGAGRNNAMTAGVSIVTGHTHALGITPVEDYRGRRWGIECGFLAHREHPAFEYAEDGPSYSRPGFVVLTWRNYALQPPELVEVDDAGVAWFRGEPVYIEKPRIRVKAIGVAA